MKKSSFFLLFFLFTHPLINAQSLVADFPFTENATDQSSFSNSATVNGAVLTTDRLGNENSAYFFDGVDDYIALENNSVLNFKDGFSISFWLKAIGTKPIQSLVSRGRGALGDYAIELQYNIGGYYELVVYIAGQTFLVEDVVNREWNHVAVSFQSGVNGIKVYLNANLVETFTYTGSFTDVSNFNFRIGNNADGGYDFVGAIDEVKVYNQTISATVVANLATPRAAEIGANLSGFGNGLSFEGEESFMVVDPLSSEDLNDFTFETMLNFKGGLNEYVIWSYGIGNDRYISLGLQNGKLKFKMNGTHPIFGYTIVVIDDVNDFPVNQWTHLAMSFDESERIVKIFVDGDLVIDETIIHSQTSINIESVWHVLGFDYVQGGQLIPAVYDETRLWGILRSQEDIQAYRKIVINQFTPGLIYTFNYDSSVAGGDNRGTDTITDIINGFKADLLSFKLIGNNSNFVKTEIGRGFPIIQGINKYSAIGGETIVIKGNGFLKGRSANRVLLGTQKLNVLNADANQILVELPNNFDSFGLSDLVVENSRGFSHPVKFSTLYDDQEYEYAHTAIQLQGGLINTLDLVLADFDGDNDVDIISGLKKLYYIENLGAATFADKVLIKDACDCPFYKAIDFDNDGDNDLIYRNAVNEIRWLENENGLFTNDILLPSLILADYDRIHFDVADLDNDGDYDFIEATRNATSSTGKLAWFKNAGNQTFVENVIINEDISSDGIGTVDIDNDGDIDFTIQSKDSIYLYFNNGLGEFDKIPIDQILNDSEGMDFTFFDFDKDNYPEIIANNNFENRMYMNGLSKGDSTFISVILPGLKESVKPVDAEGDGDIDFFMGSVFDGEFNFYKNTGDNSLEEIFLGDGALENVNPMALVDIDGDGDMDAMGVSGGDGVLRLFRHENTGNNFSDFIISDQVRQVPTMIDELNQTVDIVIPNRLTNFNLIPRFESSFRSKVYFNGLEQVSGVSVVDMSEPVVYEVISDSKDSKFWTVRLNPLPADPILIEVDDITQIAAEVEWEESAAADVYIVQISEDDFETSQFIETTELVMVLDLSPGTNYQLRIGSKNAFGSSEGFSDIEEFTTIPADPEIASIEEITTQSAVIKWIENDGTEQYLLDVAKDSTFNEFVGGYNNRGVSSLSESIIGLQAGRSYFARLRALNESGTSGNSDTITFRTIPAKPQLVLDNINQNGLSISWTTIEGVEHYDLQILQGLDTTKIKLGANVNALEIDTLLAATSYKFRLSAFNESGSSAFSDVITVLTIPATPKSLSVKEIKNTGAEIVWEEVQGANSYLLEVSSDNFSTKLSAYNPKTISATSDNLEGLSGGITYSFRIKSSNSSGQSPYSDTVSFSTIPNRPVARGASAVTASSFIANWDAVNGLNIGYYVELSKNANFQAVERQTFVNDGLSKDFTGLENGVSYWYRLAAIKATDTSQRSNSIFVEQPLQIIDFQFNEEKSREDLTRSKTSFIVKGGTNQFNVSIRYKGILSNVWSERINLEAVAQQYQYEFSNNLFDEIGLQFEINITDSLNTINTINQLENFIYLTDTEEEVVTLDLTNAWQLFSIPYNFQDNLIETIFDEMGPFEYKSEWRLMQYDGQKYVDAGGGINRIELGKSYWFYTTQEVSIKIEGATINTTSPFAMILEEGWNQIGNPYNIPISWNSVVLNNNLGGTVEAIYRYDPQAKAFVKGDRMEAFSGGFVWSNSKVEIAIRLNQDNDNQRQSRPFSEELLSQDIDADSWIVRMQLEEGASSRDIAAVGMSTNANRSKDDLDELVLPRFVNYTEMFTRHKEYFYPYFKTDIREQQEKDSWLFEYASNQSDGIATLSWSNEDFKYASKQLWLINESNGDVIAMNSRAEYSFTPQHGQQFSVHLTTGLNDLPTPFRMLIGKPFPNPAREYVQMQVGLPNAEQPYNIKFSLYGTAGEMVRFVNYNNLSAGIHDLNMQFAGEMITTGVYYLKVDIDGDHPFTQLQKLIIKD